MTAAAKPERGQIGRRKYELTRLGMALLAAIAGVQTVVAVASVALGAPEVGAAVAVPLGQVAAYLAAFGSVCIAGQAGVDMLRAWREGGRASP